MKYEVKVNGEVKIAVDDITLAGYSLQKELEASLQRETPVEVVEFITYEDNKFIRITREIGEINPTK